MKYLCTFVWLIPALVLFSPSASAEDTGCVFDVSRDYHHHLGHDEDVRFVHWSAAELAARGVTVEDELFSVQYWECDHVGAHAMLILGPYPELSSDLSGYFRRLASIALWDDENRTIDRFLDRDPVPLDSESDRVYLNDTGYNEFWLGYRQTDNLLIIEIKAVIN